MNGTTQHRWLLRLLFTGAFLLPLIGCEEPQTTAPVPDPVATWVDSLHEEGISLDRQEARNLRRMPWSYREEREQLYQHYDQLVTAIDQERDRLREAMQRDTTDSTRNLAQETLVTVIADLVAPMWLWNPWSVNGVPGDRPDFNHPTGCSHYVQRVLTDAGFNIQRSGTTWLAYLGPEQLVETFAGHPTEDLGGGVGIVERVREQGPGIYVAGVDDPWGHVGLIYYDGENDPGLYHAGPHFKGETVHYDDARAWMTAFEPFHHGWVVKIDDLLLDAWLNQTPIRP